MVGLRVTAFSAMGNRKYQEDSLSVAYQKNEDGGLDYAFFGIFDGHGGESASKFAKIHLMNYITEQKEFWSDNDDEVCDGIKKGFDDCHLAMWRNLDKWPTTSSGLPSTAGTTASIAFLRKGKLYIGHCGDSGIVLGRSNAKGGKWISEALTIEHKPESPEELARIESFGGKVQQKQGIHRVVWNRPKNPHQGPIRRNTRIEEVPFLAVARSLGDLWSYNYKTEKFVVSPEPDVKILEIDASFKCLIFASDGLWNVIDNDTAVESVYETERRNEHNAKLGINSWRNPSRILVETALENWRRNGLRADNTTVVCVMLDSPNKRQNFKNFEESEDTRRIFDYSTSEAYDLDCISGISSQYDLAESMPSTSYQPAPITYQTATRDTAIVKACCRNNYLLASANETIPYHSSYEQHREMYESSPGPYPPLHYAYRPVPKDQPLPSLHANLYDHQNYVSNFKPTMERYNYLRPTPEEVAALHEHESDDEVMDVNDEIVDTNTNTDDSIQIFEITSSNLSESENSNDETKKNNKENTESSVKKKKIVTKSKLYYATRQKDRKMRSGVQKMQGNQKKIVKTIKKVVKTKLLTEISIKKRTETATKRNKNFKNTEKVVTEKFSDIVRSLRSNQGYGDSNLMKKSRKLK